VSFYNCVGPGCGWGGGWWILGGFLWFGFWIGVVVVIVSLVRGRHHHHHEGGVSASTSALRLLEERYARGEITREEFLERRGVLTGTAPPPPPPPPAAPAEGEPTEQL